MRDRREWLILPNADDSRQCSSTPPLACNSARVWVRDRAATLLACRLCAATVPPSTTTSPTIIGPQ